VDWQTIVTAAVTALLTSGGAFLLARQRLREEFRLQFQAETVIRKLLMNEKWALRSFDVIKHHIGGFDDDELRRLLVRAGAVRFSPGGGMEMWGLYERTHHALEGTEGYEKALEPWSAACWTRPLGTPFDLSDNATRTHRTD
jgi:hypothetical protein